MTQKNSGGRMPNTRRGNKLTPSQSPIKNSDQVEHLDPTCDQHLIDVASAERQRNKGSADAATAEVALLNKPFAGFGLRPDLVANIWFGDSGAGFTDLDGHDGSAVVMEGQEWQRAIMRADTGRFKWRDHSDKLRRPQGLELLMVAEKPKPVTTDNVTGEDAEETPEAVSAKPGKGPRMSGQLAKIYARLAPWVALAAGKELTREKLVEVATRVANAFQLETGKRVLAANIHVESDHDIHLHLTFSALVPEISKKKYSGDYIKKILAKQRKEVKNTLLNSGNEKPSRIQIQAGLESLYATGGLTHPGLTKMEVIYRRLSRPKAKEGRRNLLSMGPAYCSKTTLWDASGRDPQVAGVNENALAKAFSFGEVVMGKVKKSPNPNMKDLGPEDHYIDYWLWKTWKATVEGVLSEKTREQLPELAMPFVQRYIQDGKSLPNPVLDASRRKAAQESFEALDKARKTLAGSDVPPTTATTIPELAGEISKVLVEKEQNAMVRGLKKAFAMVFEVNQPASNEPENLEKEITAGISAIKTGAVMAAWKTVWTFFNTGRDSADTPNAIKKEIKYVIARRISNGIIAVFKNLSHDTVKSTMPLDAEAEFAVENFKTEAKRSAVKLALTAITGTADPAHDKMELEALKAELDLAIKPVRGGLESATRTLVEGVLGKKVAESSPDPMQAVKNRFQHLKKFEKLTLTLLKDLRRNPLALNLSPAGDKAFTQLVDIADSLPGPEVTEGKESRHATPKEGVKESRQNKGPEIGG
jgi:hypothetical protein